MGTGDGGSWNGRELAADDDDPLGGSSGSWDKIELDRSDGPAVPASQQQDPTDFGGGRMIGDAFDGVDGVVDLPMPDLDTDAIRGSSPRHPAPFARGAPADRVPGGVAPTAPVARSFAPPSDPAGPRASMAPRGSLAPAAPDSDLSPAEVTLLADYGPAPSGIVGTVPYAILVLTRRRALQKALSDLRRLHVTAETDSKEALIDLGRALHANKSAELLSPLASFMVAADETGRVAGQRTEEWEKARQTADAQRGSLAAKIEQAEKAAGPYRDRETKLATQMNVRENELRRAKAKLQRAEIEMRNLAATPDPGRQPLLEAERLARRAEVDKAQGHVDELAPQLAAARRELTVMVQAINDLETQRRTVDQAQHRTERVHLSSAGEAEKHYHAAVSHLAEQALVRKIAEAVAPDAAKNARFKQATADARAKEIRVHEAALLAYDRPSLQKGLTILGIAGAAILAMILFVILR